MSSKRRPNFSKCIQNTRVNAGRLLDRVNTLLEFEMSSWQQT